MNFIFIAKRAHRPASQDAINLRVRRAAQIAARLGADIDRVSL